MPRYVILTHEPPPNSDQPRHWDLMLEDPQSLRTWALASPPHDQCQVAAKQLPAHRRHYLDYEGPISRNRGSVTRWDAGSYQPIVQQDDLLEIEVMGQRLVGRITLTCDTVSEGGHWTLRHEDTR